MRIKKQNSELKNYSLPGSKLEVFSKTLEKSKRLNLGPRRQAQGLPLPSLGHLPAPSVLSPALSWPTGLFPPLFKHLQQLVKELQPHHLS